MSYKGIILLIFTVLAFLLSIENVFADVPTTNPSDLPPTNSQNYQAFLSSFTADEKNYLTQAYSYMAMEQKEGLLVAGMIANLASGAATVVNLGDAIRSALSEINNAYSLYTKVYVPPKYSQLNSNIINTYTLFNSAYTEFLKYWSDGNEVHIENGGPVLEKAAAQQHDIILYIIKITTPKS